MSNLYNVLVRPLITEKSNLQSSKFGHYVFVVDKDATRIAVKDAVETLFDVTVARVNIINVPAKRGRRGKSRRMAIRKPGFKKAIITLAEGSKTFEFFEGVQ